ncbi:MAG: hypothetical protein MJ224_00215 [archaeon]|nr:hypothetical protein [archaeon]
MTIKEIRITDFDYADNEIKVEFTGKMNDSANFVIELINILEKYTEVK